MGRKMPPGDPEEYEKRVKANLHASKSARKATEKPAAGSSSMSAPPPPVIRGKNRLTSAAATKADAIRAVSFGHILRYKRWASRIPRLNALPASPVAIPMMGTKSRYDFKGSVSATGIRKAGAFPVKAHMTALAAKEAIKELASMTGDTLRCNSSTQKSTPAKGALK